jgi:hypothetical protein
MSVDETLMCSFQVIKFHFIFINKITFIIYFKIDFKTI